MFYICACNRHTFAILVNLRVNCFYTSINEKYLCV